MVREKAVVYIRKSRAEGFTDDEIRKELESAGWPEKEINLAFTESQIQASSSYIKETETPKNEEPAVPGSPSFGRANLVVEGILKRSNVPRTPVVAARPPLFRPGFKKALIIIFAVIAVVGGAAGGYWYYKTNIYPNRLRASALDTFGSLKQLRYESRLTMRVKNDSNQARDLIEPFAPQFTGLILESLESDKNSTEGVQQISVELAVDADTRDAKNQKRKMIATVHTGGYLGGDLSYESRLVGGAYYFSFPNLPDSMQTVYGFDARAMSTSSPIGKWMRADVGTFAASYASSIEHLKTIDASLDAHLAQSKRLADRIMFSPSSDLMQVAEKLKDISWNAETFSEDIAGDHTIRFRGFADSQILAAIRILMQSDASDDRLKKLSTALAALKNTEVNLWVSEATGNIVKLTVQGASGDSASGIAEFVYSLQFKKIVDLMALEAPQGAYDINDIALKLGGVMTRGLEIGRELSRDAARAADLEKIQSALMLYINTKQRYPDTLAALVPEFMAILPKDPLTGKNYGYRAIGSKDYILSAQFENREDPLLKGDFNPKNTLYEVKP
jgi:hypothetical protein